MEQKHNSERQDEAQVTSAQVLPSPVLAVSASPDNIMSDFEMDDDTCPKCGCCSMVWHECENCGGEGGRDGDELMEEDPLWYSQDDYEQCDICDGKGGWYVCVGECDENGKHGDVC